jgi:hypothetical protein
MSRPSQAVLAERRSLVEEMAEGELGDRRLTARRDRLITVLEQHPDVGFPDACADDADVEALYRFLRNRRVSWEAVLAPHLTATAARCQALGDVLVVHDTTDMVFRGATARVGLATLGEQRHGFWLHASLAVSADGVRAPLGIVAVKPFIRKTQPPGKPKRHQERFADPDKESRCWMDGVRAARAQLGAMVGAVHLMDREGDSYELLAALIAEGERFIVRLNHDRRVIAEAPTDPGTKLSDLCGNLSPWGEREVYVSPRGGAAQRPLHARKKHPAREGRLARLRFAARPITLRRPKSYTHTPPTLAVHVVSVWEVGAPVGVHPIAWRLVTTESIATPSDVTRVIDAYRTRWVIEELFKSLKTGCAYEKRQLESLPTLLVALALLLPIAWQLLLWRHLARADATTPARALFHDRQLTLLAAAGRPPLPARCTLREALRAVARLGGHLTHNGDPGWIVLGRGMQKLLWMEAGWTAAMGAQSDQS